MEKRKFKIIFRLAWILYVLISFDVLAQEAPSLGEEHWDLEKRDQVVFDDFSLRKYQDDPVFSYHEELSEESLWDRIRRWPGKLWSKFWAWLLAGEEATGFLALVIRILPYFAVVGLLVVLVWVLANLERDLSGRGAVKNTQVRLFAEEEIIRNSNIDDLIEEARASKNYSLAIRYYYLQALQLLIKKGLINWQDQKTNADYIREIPDGNLRDTFARVTLAYDSIWYGNYEVDEDLFARTVRAFEMLKAFS